ncbi:MAG: MvdD family ATP-grasp ribosomal peptide maturase [Vulcanimicrobiota bacterium]
MNVLIITHSRDNASVALVSEQLVARGARVWRLDTDLYPQQLRLSSQLGGGASRRLIELPNGACQLEELQACWYRRFAAGTALPLELGDTRPACLAEAQQTMYGAIASLDCLQIDPLSSVRRADLKEVQLEQAGRFGLTIPRTLISNDPERARQFFDECAGQVVTKTQTSFAIYRDQAEQVVFTSQVRPEHLDQLQSLAYAPMMFQEMLPKRLELRATIVGGQIFTAAIDSTRHQGAEVDWRRKGLELIDDWRPYPLPEEVGRGLLKLAGHFGLRYGAADLVVTPAGQHVFLELNAGGEWFWLQRCLPIAQALADCLLHG